MALYAGNANDIVRTLRLASTGADVTDATLTAKVYDPHETLVATITMTNQGDDEYRGSTSTNFIVGVRYKTVITASNYQFRAVLHETCTEREEAR